MQKRVKQAGFKLDISKNKYQELKFFCMQYKEKKTELEDAYGLCAVAADGVPGGSKIGKPTENRAVRNAELEHEVKIIEESAERVSKTLAPYILNNVTEGIAYEYMNVPCGRKQFYEARRYFFYLLSLRR